jgi:hypothetical protein
MPNGSSLAAGAAPQPSLSLFGTVGVPLTVVAAIAVLLIGVLALRSRQKKKARAAAAARLAAARTEVVSMPELRGAAKPAAEQTAHRTPPALQTRKVDPARRFAEPRTEVRRTQDVAWPSTGEWRAVTAPASNGANGTNGTDSRQIAARLGGATPERPVRRNSAQRTEMMPQRNGATRVNGGNGATRVNGAGDPNLATRLNGAVERGEATPVNGAARARPGEQNGQPRVAQQRNGNGQRVPRPATVPQRGPQPTNGHEPAQDPGWPAEPDWPN